jgi:hypothetical protein
MSECDHHWEYIWSEDIGVGYWQCSLCPLALAELPDDICEDCDPVGYPMCSRCLGV